MTTASDSTIGTPVGVRALRETRVGEAVHAGVLTCPVEAPLCEVARIMTSKQVHCVVVLSETQDGEALWGVLSDLDLVAGASVRNLEEQSAGGTAASPVVMIAPGDTLLRAARLMTEHATAHLVVVAPDSRLPVGVLSTLDVARTVAASACTTSTSTRTDGLR